MNFESVKPTLAYIASLTFGGMSLASLLQMLINATSSVLALMGIFFGAAGAYYTFRIQRRTYLKKQDE